MNNSEGAVSRSIIKIKLFVIKSYRRTSLMWHLHNTGTATGASALHTPPHPHHHHHHSTEPNLIKSPRPFNTNNNMRLN